jgi:hypothetical protein
MKLHYLFPALLLAGCASSHPTAVDVGPGPLPQKHNVSDPASIRTPEQVKAYPVGRYEDPNDPDVMHEGHTVYRAETSPEWDTDPNEPTSLPLGPGEMATADPAQEHTALTAELEQRLKQEDQLLQTTYEQNERLAQEIKTLQDEQPHVRLSVPDPQCHGLRTLSIHQSCETAGPSHSRGDGLVSGLRCSRHPGSHCEQIAQATRQSSAERRTLLCRKRSGPTSA